VRHAEGGRARGRLEVVAQCRGELAKLVQGVPEVGDAAMEDQLLDEAWWREAQVGWRRLQARMAQVRQAHREGRQEMARLESLRGTRAAVLQRWLEAAREELEVLGVQEEAMDGIWAQPSAESSPLCPGTEAGAGLLHTRCGGGDVAKCTINGEVADLLHTPGLEVKGLWGLLEEARPATGDSVLDPAWWAHTCSKARQLSKQATRLARQHTQAASKILNTKARVQAQSPWGDSYDDIARALSNVTARGRGGCAFDEAEWH
jgi:hypothetical protein